MLLFVNACFREGSRTERLARQWLVRRAYNGEVVELRLGEIDVAPLDVGGPNTLAAYNASVADATFDHPMFSFAQQFASADEVLIAAPFWNYGLPAKLHAYLELVCSQGVSFDISDTGAYVGLVACKRLTFITTAGGAKPDSLDDHAFGYVRTVAECLLQIPQVDCIAAWGLDGPGAYVDALLADALG